MLGCCANTYLKISMKRHIFVLMLLLACVDFCCAMVLNVRSFGAVGDGKNIDSDAINKAIIHAQCGDSIEMLIRVGMGKANGECDSGRL